jgi:uncharacterized membrane protein YdbT with pleckstrin-like domain
MPFLRDEDWDLGDHEPPWWVVLVVIVVVTVVLLVLVAYLVFYPGR